MTFCPQCGAAVNPGASFCSACGATIAAAGMPAPPVAAGIAAPPLAAPAARVRPVGVTIIGIVTIVVGAIAAMAAFAMVVFFGAMGAMFTAMFGDFGGAMGAFMGSLALIAAIFVIGFAILGIATGLGVLRGSSWAWAVMLVFMALNILGGLGSLAQRDAGGVVSLLVSGVVIWYFFQPDVKAWFGKQA